MITLSLCMIVKDEEEVIARCLDSVKNVVDEIVIVDTGSKDKTKEICKKYTDLVYDFKWVDDFSKARNYSFSKTTKDYIIWLVADDVIEEKDRKELINLKNTLDNKVDIVMLKYNTGFDKDGNVTFSYYRERILKREKNFKWISPIHEVIVPSGNIIYSDIAITHRKIKESDPKRNIKIFKKMLKEGYKLDLRQQFYYSRELYYNKEYKEAIKNFNKFIDSKDGFLENKINACIDLSNCYRLLNDNRNAFISLTKSFLFDKPRAEICCRLGAILFEEAKYNEAIFWYDLATKCTLDETKGGFYEMECYDFLPYIQICVCYFKLGNIEEAIKYNELAGKIKPTSEAYLYNKNFFNNLNNY